MYILSIIEIILLILYVIFLVNEYSAKSVPMYIKILTFISWLMSFGIVLVIPHDIYYVRKINLKNIWFFLKTFQITDGQDPTGHNNLLRIW